MKVYLTSILTACLLVGVARSETVSVTVTIRNLAPTNSISFAPLRLGFHNGTFDAFNNGQVATAPIISVAEGGSGSAWFPAFAAAEPAATLGSVGGALLPGATASNTFTVDTALNQFFTFGSMVIPSNDHFIGNDSPTRFRLFDAAGNLLITSIDQRARDIWDNGSEVTDPLNSAFLVGGTNALRTPQNGVVSFNFSELSAFDGLTTAAGYTLNTQLLADTSVYRIEFASQAVPAPASLVLVLVGTFGMAIARRLRRDPQSVTLAV